MTEILFQDAHGSRPVQVAFETFRNARKYIANVAADLRASGVEIAFQSAQRVTTVSGRSVFIKGA